MVLVICCEDHEGEAEKTIRRLGDIGVPVTGEHVDYKMSTGAVRGVPQIVNEVCGHVYKAGVNTIFLVDLSPDEDVESKEHGLNVIGGVQKELLPGGTIMDFLKSKNFLTIVVTVHALRASDLAKAWKVKVDDIDIVPLSDCAAVSRIVSEHSTKAILAYVAKRIDEARIPSLVAQWSKVAGDR
jgi:hypothetical protein